MTLSRTIRNVQYQHLVEMLNFNLPDSDPNRPVWKLFIMDSAGQRILAPLIKVNDLREHGVTLFLQLKSQRDRVPDVPAVYFVEPSPESISLICQDLRNNVYDSYYLNFTSQISRDSLEELAQLAHQTQTHLKIAKVYDQYLNYITLEDNLFTLEAPIGVKYNVFNFNEKQSSSIVDSTVSGIFSVLMSFGCCAPIICTSQSTTTTTATTGLAPLICGKLESKIRNHLINTKSSISLSNPQAGSNQPRPLLLVLDRRIDLAGPLKHSASYNALIDEILGINSNQIQVPGGKSFDIDRRDWFWRENSTKSFPKVAEAVETALKAYKLEYDRVLQTTPGMTEDLMKSAGESTTDTTGPGQGSLTPEQLKIAINVLPELTERKRLIDTHLQISTALLDSIKTRDLGTLFNIEQEIVNSYFNSNINNTNTSTSSTVNILSTLKDSKIGNSNDKMRLLLIYLIYNFKNLSNNSNFIQEALNILKPNSDDLKTVQSLLNILSGDHPASISSSNNLNNPNITKPTSPVNQNQVNPLTSSSSNFGDLFNRISSTTNVLVSSVKNLIPIGGAVAESPLTRLLDSTYAQVTTGKQSLPISAIDPRPKIAQNNQNVHSIDHVILFIIGGAAYSEYDNLLDHFEKSKSLQNLKFTLGVSEIINPKKYLNQLNDSDKRECT